MPRKAKRKAKLDLRIEETTTTLPTVGKRLTDKEVNDENGRGYSFTSCGEDLAIKSIPTAKDKIEQPKLAADEKMYIPPIGSSIIFSGKSGSGKSTLLANLLTDSRFYGPSDTRPDGFFDKIFLFSPTAGGDDIQKSLGIPKNHIFTDLDDAPELLELILHSQQTKLEKDSADKVEQYLIIFDDVIGDVQFMNEKAFTMCFYMVRHTNCTTMICSQHFNRIPRVCRLQANFIFFFQGNQGEVDMIVEEFAPPMYNKNEMRQMVTEATQKKFSFLTINMKVGWELRFRRNLDEFVDLHRLECQEEVDNGESKSDDSTDKDKDTTPEKYEQKGEKSDHVLQDISQSEEAWAKRGKSDLKTTQLWRK